MRTEPLPVIEPISSAAADALMQTVAKAGGGVPDLMTALVLVACKVMAATFPDGRDEERAETLGNQVANILPALREARRDRAEVLQ